MGALAVPIMVGAAVGGGSSLLRGKGLGGILQGAALGGAGGALTGGIGGAFGGGAAGGASGGAAGGAGGASTGALANAAQFEASMGLPSTAFLENGGSLATALGGTTKSMGLIPTGIGSSLSMNPEYYSNILGNQVYKGGEGLLANATNGILSGLPDYVTPQNLIGAAKLVSEQGQQPSFASPGGMKAGSFNPNNASSTGIAVRKKEQGYA